MKTLTDIIKFKELEVKKSKQIFSRDFMEEQIEIIGNTRGFCNAIVSNENSIGIIAEIKKASPSKGLIRKNFDPIDIANIYSKNNATCLSILTDEHFFKGKNAYIKSVKNVSKLPILRKDFIIDNWQIKETRALGADCILLILSCLSKNQVKEYEEEAFNLGMDVLIEAHSEKEVELSNEFNSKLIGINNRDLKSMKVNIKNSIHLMKYVNKDKIIISESGISSYKDILLLKENGICNFLIGEALMREKNISTFFNKIKKNIL